MTEQQHQDRSHAQVLTSGHTPAQAEQANPGSQRLELGWESVNGHEIGGLSSAPASLELGPTPSFSGRILKDRKALPSEPRDEVAYQRFRQVCDRLVTELKRIDDYFDGDKVRDEGLEIVAEIECLLESLYDCGWGQGECLKRVVVAIQSQVNNIPWVRKHVEFLRDITRHLRVRYVIDESTVEACYDMMAGRRLDPFRGTVSTGPVTKKYRLEEVQEP